MGSHARVPMHGFLCIGSYAWVPMHGFLCRGSYAWAAMHGMMGSWVHGCMGSWGCSRLDMVHKVALALTLLMCAHVCSLVNGGIHGFMGACVYGAALALIWFMGKLSP